jgi:hypothetical protein
MVIKKKLDQVQKMMDREKSRDAAKVVVKATELMLELLGELVGMDDRVAYLKNKAITAKQTVARLGKDL